MGAAASGSVSQARLLRPRERPAHTPGLPAPCCPHACAHLLDHHLPQFLCGRKVGAASSASPPEVSSSEEANKTCFRGPGFPMLCGWPQERSAKFARKATERAWLFVTGSSFRNTVLAPREVWVMWPRKFQKVPESSRRLPCSGLAGVRAQAFQPCWRVGGGGGVDVASWSLSRLSEGDGLRGPWGRSRVRRPGAGWWIRDLSGFVATSISPWEAGGGTKTVPCAALSPPPRPVFLGAVGAQL